MFKKPEILIISNKYDFSTDYVIYKLEKLKANYLRLNQDELGNYKILMNPQEEYIECIYNNSSYKISNNHLKSIYYRAPTFLRINTDVKQTEETQFYKNQWSAFVRSLVIFNKVYWMNHPMYTYLAEIKPYQLIIAKEVGLKTPKTFITNDFELTKYQQEDEYAIKTLDAGIIQKRKSQSFVYTNISKGRTFKHKNISSAPVIFQNALLPKTDLRVTIVGNKAYAVSITSKKQINDDWRLHKDKLDYTAVELPSKIITKCKLLLGKLNLNFGAIDLIKYKDDYFFIEINPTGEWSWFIEKTGFDIDQQIAQCLNLNSK